MNVQYMDVAATTATMAAAAAASAAISLLQNSTTTSALTPTTAGPLSTVFAQGLEQRDPVPIRAHSTHHSSLSTTVSILLATSPTVSNIDFDNTDASYWNANQTTLPLTTIANLHSADDQYVYFRDTVRFWVQRVLVPLIMVVGIVGNSITMVIMTRRRMRSSTNWYLAALAIFDMIYLIFTFVLSLKHYPNAHDGSYYLYWYLFPFSMMITDASSNTSVWLTVTFTIERYIAVCHPIKGKVICTESRAKRVILCVFLICVSVTVPTPFEWIVLERFDPTTNRTTMEAMFSELGQNATYRNIYYHLNVFLFVLVPLALLVIFNTFLIRSVHQSNKQRAKMMMGKDNYQQSNAGHANNNNNNTTCHHHGSNSNSHQQHFQPNKSEPTLPSSSSRQEIRITVMLIAVVILFIVCQTPTACILVYTAFYQYEPDSNEEYLLLGLSNIFNFLMSINAAGNFLLYCLLSQKYRRTFVAMFCPCLTRKYLQSHSTYHQPSRAANMAASVGQTKSSNQNHFNSYNNHQHHHHHHHANPHHHQYPNSHNSIVPQQTTATGNISHNSREQNASNNSCISSSSSSSRSSSSNGDKTHQHNSCRRMSSVNKNGTSSSPLDRISS